jgi:hypothetical protein
MKPLDIKEWAESLLLGEHGDFAKEILRLVDLEQDYDEQKEWVDLAVRDVPEAIKKQGHQKVFVWINKQLLMLDDIKEQLEKAGFFNPDFNLLDNIEVLCEDYKEVDRILTDCGFVEGDVIEKVHAAMEKIHEPLEYDL